jgi:hypothetical protein
MARFADKNFGDCWIAGHHHVGAPRYLGSGTLRRLRQAAPDPERPPYLSVLGEIREGRWRALGQGGRLGGNSGSRSEVQSSGYWHSPFRVFLTHSFQILYTRLA